jgi:hypothetical protein
MVSEKKPLTALPGPIVLETGEWERLAKPNEVKTEEIKPETAPDEPKRRKRAQKPPESPEFPENDLETRLKRDQVSKRVWINPFDDGLDDTGALIARMSQHGRDRILDRLVSKQRS